MKRRRGSLYRRRNRRGDGESDGAGRDDLVLVIGNKNYSSWSMRPWLVLRHFNIAFEEVRLSLDSSDFGERISQYSAARKVPVLRHADLTVWDSLAICEYLAELRPALALWPAKPPARAAARSVAAEMHSGFASLRSQLPMNFRATGRSVAIGDETRTEIARIDAIWAERPAGGPFLFGEFCIADAMYAPVVSRFVTYGIETSPAARAYMDAIVALPAYRQWMSEAAEETEILPQDEAGLR